MHKSFFYDISIPGVTLMNVLRPSTTTRDGMFRIWEWGGYVQSIGQRSRQLDFNARTGSGREASFQHVISMPLTSCLSKSQLSPAMVDSSRTCARFYRTAPACTLQKSTFVRCRVRLGGIRAASINVKHDLIDTPALKFCFAWTVLDDLYISR